MARFDVFRWIGAGGGYVVDVQASLLYELDTRVVIPLLPLAAVRPIRELNPIVHIGDQAFVAMTQDLASVPRFLLRHSVASLDAHRDDLTRALDTLLIGF
jgi:toxin CcdB